MCAKNSGEHKNCFDIQKKVFAKEQGIPEKLVVDDKSPFSTYVYALVDKKKIGAARYRKTKTGFKLERFAVLKRYRNKGVGKLLVRFMEQQIGCNKKIYLHAQETVVGFYSAVGYQKVGDKFSEAGIPHWKMIKIW